MAEPQGAYFYIIAVAGPNGFRSEAYGTVSPHPAATRLDVFKDLRTQVLSQCPPQSSVVAFHLEPNAIGA